MSVPAMYIAREGATPRQLTVRVHTSFAALGRPPARSAVEYAERDEAKPKLIFSTDEILSVKVGATISVEAGEAYHVESVEPPDDTTITAEVTRVPAAAAAGLPLPVVII